jgi:exopolysaccharide biosynthesis predicted pyruvyltransferase EpsI
MVSQYQNNYVENFLFGIYISKAVITDSFHGIVFSIIFNLLSTILKKVKKIK